MTGQYHPSDELNKFLIRALEGASYCCNDGCDVMGQRNDFHVCRRCKTARRCVSETRLGCRWAQDDGWHIRL